MGGFGQGIEVLGFGYQMQLAGAKSTLSSLWSVSDGGTQVLMDSFYNSFAQRKDGIVSLKEAQVAMIRQGDNLSPSRKRGFEALRSGLPAKVQGKLHHPFYWSPFIVIVNQF
ncbi:MAG: CHAT domain-containing protein [Oscillatoriales cyanobacterium SM2_2_1]|nr:CHAT domain-containing protein [Oscillatoriales cyanobacterium SM2_2_1]